MGCAFRALRKFGSDTLSLVVQSHHSDEIELDSELEDLIDHAEQIKSWTEKTVIATCGFVSQPEAAQPVSRRAKINVNEHKDLDRLGSSLIAVGQELSPSCIYGGALIELGRTQYEICDLMREFAAKANREFLDPLQQLLEVEASQFTAEKKALNLRRQELSLAIKNFRRSKSNYEATITSDSLRQTQQYFNEQARQMRWICTRIISLYNHQHLNCIRKFIEAQAEFNESSSKLLRKLLKGNKRLQNDPIPYQQNQTDRPTHSGGKKIYSPDVLRTIARNMNICIEKRFLSPAPPPTTKRSNHQAALYVQKRRKPPRKTNKRPTSESTSDETIERTEEIVTANDWEHLIAELESFRLSDSENDLTGSIDSISQMANTIHHRKLFGLFSVLLDKLTPQNYDVVKTCEVMANRDLNFSFRLIKKY